MKSTDIQKKDNTSEASDNFRDFSVKGMLVLSDNVEIFSLKKEVFTKIDSVMKIRGNKSKSNSSNEFTILHTGKIEPVLSSMYSYRGGDFVIKLNEIECLRYSNTIKSTNRHGNPEEDVRKEIKESMYAIIQKETNEIVNDLSICLEKFGELASN